MPVAGYDPTVVHLHWYVGSSLPKICTLSQKLHNPTHCLSALLNVHRGSLNGTCVIGPITGYVPVFAAGSVMTFINALMAGVVTLSAFVTRYVPRYWSNVTGREQKPVMESTHLE